MPELPEVQAARSLVHENCVGKTIVRATAADDDKVFQGMSPDAISKALIGRRLLDCKRIGKYFWWEVGHDPSNGDPDVVDMAAEAPVFHFGMNGKINIEGVGSVKYVRDSGDDCDWPPRFMKLEVEFSDGTLMAFCDSRRFARIVFQKEPLQCEPLKKLGPDAHEAMPSVDDFGAILAKRKKAIKAVLLDQSILAGIGNWVGDEVLYMARVHPEQIANTLPDDKVRDLHGAIAAVLDVSVAADADADAFPESWLFHARWTGGQTTRHGGKTVSFLTVGGRTSAYVPSLQKMVAGKTPEASSKKPAATKRRPTKRPSKAALETDDDDDDDEDEDYVDMVGEEEAAAERKPRKRAKKAPAAPKKEAALSKKEAAAAKRAETAAAKKAAAAAKREAAAEAKKAAADAKKAAAAFKREIAAAKRKVAAEAKKAAADAKKEAAAAKKTAAAAKTQEVAAAKKKEAAAAKTKVSTAAAKKAAGAGKKGTAANAKPPAKKRSLENGKTTAAKRTRARK